MKKIIFATNNAHKLSEIRGILGSEFEIVSLEELGCHDDIPETADTLEGNREPVFGLKEVLFADVKTLGMDGKHLAIAFRGSGLRAVWWNHGDLVEKIRAASAVPHDVLFTLAVSEYGERHAEPRLVSIAGL